MSGGLGGLGTSSNTINQNTTQDTSSFNQQSGAQSSQTSPWGPAIGGLQGYLNQNPTYAGIGNTQYQNLLESGTAPNQAWNYGMQGEENLYNPLMIGAANLANTGQNFINKQGDPYGILGGIQSSIGDINNIQNSPGMAGVLKTIQNDTENAINSQFAGAGRSLSGLNTQALARGLAQGEAQPLLNQYNTDISTLMGINQARQGGVGFGMGLQQAAPGLAMAAPQAAMGFNQQTFANPLQLAGAAENLLLPIAGLGGSASGQQVGQQSGIQNVRGTQVGTGTQTASPLSQIGSGVGILGGIGSLLGGFGLV